MMKKLRISIEEIIGIEFVVSILLSSLHPHHHESPSFTIIRQASVIYIKHSAILF